MKPSDEAKTVSPANVQLGRAFDDADAEDGDAAGDAGLAEPLRRPSARAAPRATSR